MPFSRRPPLALRKRHSCPSSALTLRKRFSAAAQPSALFSKAVPALRARESLTFRLGALLTSRCQKCQRDVSNAPYLKTRDRRGLHGVLMSCGEGAPPLFCGGSASLSIRGGVAPSRTLRAGSNGRCVAWSWLVGRAPRNGHRRLYVSGARPAATSWKGPPWKSTGRRTARQWK